MKMFNVGCRKNTRYTSKYDFYEDCFFREKALGTDTL